MSIGQGFFLLDWVSKNRTIRGAIVDGLRNPKEYEWMGLDTFFPQPFSRNELKVGIGDDRSGYLFIWWAFKKELQRGNIVDGLRNPKSMVGWGRRPRCLTFGKLLSYSLGAS